MKPFTRFGPRGSQMVRQWKVLIFLRSQPRTLAWLAGELRTSTRTIRRDIEVLEMVGFPIVKLGGDTDDDWLPNMPSIWSVWSIQEWPRRHALPVEMLRGDGRPR